MKWGLILAVVAATGWLWGYLGTEQDSGAEIANVGGGIARLSAPYGVGAGGVIALIGDLAGRGRKR